MNINQLSLLDVIKKYFGYSDDDFTPQGKGKYLTKCPVHSEKNGQSMAIYQKPTGWDWCCFGACQTGGSATNLLMASGKADTAEEAAHIIRKDFGLELPEKVTLDNFAEIKGYSLDFLASRGITGSDAGVDIPYYDEEGNVLAIKRRVRYEGKQRFYWVSGANMLYGRETLAALPNTEIVLVEGETDTLTAMQAGLPCLGIPGAASWQPEWLDAIRKFEKVIIVPDQDKAKVSGQATAAEQLLAKLQNDIPDKLYIVNLPKGYKDLSAYYLYACNANVELFLENYKELAAVPGSVITLIKDIQDDPSVILDTANWLPTLTGKNDAERLFLVEQIQTATKIQKKTLNAAYSAAVKALPKNVVAETTEKVIEENNCYYKWEVIKDCKVKKKLTNFVLKLKYTIKNPDHTQDRVIQLVGEHGYTVGPIPFDGKVLTMPSDFAVFVKSYGPFTFTGNMEDLAIITDHLFGQTAENMVHASHNIGHVGDRWLLGKIGVDENGIQVAENTDGFMEFPDKKYLVKNINISDDGDGSTSDSISLPLFPVPPLTRDLREVRVSLASAIRQNLNGFEPWLGLGWAVANWYSDSIYKHNGDMCYPIFFIAGKRNSGKTVLARWLMALAGFPHIEGKNFGTPTVVSIARKLGYYASLPLWYDDFRNDIKDIGHRTEFLLGVYNRQGADKGLRQTFGVRSEPIRGTLLLSGEDVPNDSALYSRTVLIHTTAYGRNDAYLPQVRELVPYFPQLGLHFCKQSQREGAAPILKALDAAQAWLMEHGMDGRLAKNYAVCIAGLQVGFEDVIPKEDWAAFMEWVLRHAEQDKIVRADSHVTHTFMSDLANLIHSRTLGSEEHFKIKDGVLWLWYGAVYDHWAKYAREHSRSSINKNTMSSYLDKEPSAVPEQRIYLGKTRQRCRGIDLRLCECEDLQNVCDAIVQGEEF